MSQKMDNTVCGRAQLVKYFNLEDVDLYFQKYYQYFSSFGASIPASNE